ncbi:hypothetical protein B0H13DRAFT_2341068 [Mycena leptocephala]|nr:hypothetical protein B0H13DRAFT_2341068 [Mycena leptocephala]
MSDISNDWFDPSLCFPPDTPGMGFEDNNYDYQQTDSEFSAPGPACCDGRPGVANIHPSSPAPDSSRDAINLPRGAIPSKQARAPATDEARKLIGQSTTRTTKQRSDTDQHSSDADPKRVAFKGRDLLQIGRAVVAKQPFLAPHRGIAAAWKEVNMHLRANGFRHDVKYTTIQNKAKAMIAFKKDPTCEDAKSVAPYIAGDIAILIASTLEQMEQQYDDAKGKTDDAKRKLKEKSEEDRSAGEAIRAASMRARKRPASRSVSPATGDDTDPETLQKTPGRLSATSSLDLSDAEGSKKPAKRRKTDRRTGNISTTSDIVKILEKDIAQRAEYQQEAAATMKGFVADAKEGRTQIIGLLEKILESDSKK